MTTPSSLTLASQKNLDSHFQTMKVQLSEFCFANLYLFREAHDYSIVHYDNKPLYLLGKSYDNKNYAMPLCPPENLSPDAFSTLLSTLNSAEIFFPIPENWLPYFPADSFLIESMESDSDYLYTREKLQNYPGKKLHSKRNLYRQFEANEKIQVLPLSTPTTLMQANLVLDQWLTESKLASDAADSAECREALQLLQTLNLSGFLFLVNDKPVGFSIGELLAGDTYVIHFVKALRSYKGVYQYIFSKTAELLPPQVKWINLEQDLGQEGLRAMKLSYLPDEILKKYRISLI